jgi:hypothetical protein
METTIWIVFVQMVENHIVEKIRWKAIGWAVHFVPITVAVELDFHAVLELHGIVGSRHRHFNLDKTDVIMAKIGSDKSFCFDWKVFEIDKAIIIVDLQRKAENQ